MKNLFFIFLSFMLSCSTRKDFIDVKYKAYSNTAKKTYVYKIYIKDGFTLKEINGGNEWKQKEYKYSDNSVFYISSEDGNTSLNYDNIRNDKIQSNKSFIAFANKDTITLYGIDKKGNYWKNKFDGEVNIGYLNIPEEKKAEFDKIISSIIKK